MLLEQPLGVVFSDLLPGHWVGFSRITLASPETNNRVGSGMVRWSGVAIDVLLRTGSAQLAGAADECVQFDKTVKSHAWK